MLQLLWVYEERNAGRGGAYIGVGGGGGGSRIGRLVRAKSFTPSYSPELTRTRLQWRCVRTIGIESVNDWLCGS